MLCLCISNSDHKSIIFIKDLKHIKLEKLNRLNLILKFGYKNWENIVRRNKARVMWVIPATQYKKRQIMKNYFFHSHLGIVVFLQILAIFIIHS